MKNKDTCVDAADWLNEPDEPHLVRAVADGIQIATRPGVFNYTIEWERLNDPLRVLGWVRHITEKVWFTADMCRDFIDAVSKHWGWGEIRR